MIHTLYGKHYHIFRLSVCPADQGHAGVSRDRIYLILALKGKVTPVCDVNKMYSRVSAYIAGKVQTRPSDYLVSDVNELKAEAARISHVRRKIIKKRVRVAPLVIELFIRLRRFFFLVCLLFFNFNNVHHFFGHLQVKLTLGGKRMSMRYLLNGREARGVKYAAARYKLRFNSHPRSNPEYFVFLGDTPSERLCWSAGNGRLPTYRRNGGFFWHEQSESILTARDKLASLGFPVTANTAMSMGVPVIPVKDRFRAASVAGNSFHFASAAVVQLIVPCCFKLSE